MSYNELKVVKKEFKVVKIDLHESDKALVIHYRLTAIVCYANNKYSEDRVLNRLIYYPNLTTKSNSQILAIETTEKFPIFLPSHVQQLQESLQLLKTRKYFNVVNIDINKLSVTDASGGGGQTVANFNRIPAYIEMFYEDLDSKVKASAFILQLAKIPDNLQQLSENESLLSVLARVLREYWKKNITLCTNIVYVFFTFSTYVDFHHIIMKYKIGSQCMEILKFEADRYEKWQAELNELESATKPVSGVPKRSNSQNELPIVSSPSTNPVKCRIPQLIRPKSGNWATESHELAANPLWSLASRTSSASSSSTTLSSINSSTAAATAAETIETRRKRLQHSIVKQEQLLRAAVYLLLNLADNRKVEAKMAAKGIVERLAVLLQRQNTDLIVLVLTFLRKLSRVYENIERMKEFGVLDRLVPLLKHWRPTSAVASAPVTKPEIVQLTLRLLYNCSFDKQLADEIRRLNLLPLILDLFSVDKYQAITTKIMYLFSFNDSVKDLFAVTNLVTLIIDLILLSRENALNKPLVALAMNLALSERNAVKMIANDRLAILLKKAFRTKDLALVKLLRNVSDHEPLKRQFIDYVGDLANILASSMYRSAGETNRNREFLIECLIIFGNALIPELDQLRLIIEFKLNEFFTGYLTHLTANRTTDVRQPDTIDYELLYEMLVLIRRFVWDEKCASFFVANRLPAELVRVLKTYQENDRIVLAVLCVFYAFLQHRTTRTAISTNTEIIAYQIDLLNDSHPQIKQISRRSLLVVKSFASEWQSRIQLELFRGHNGEWIRAIEALKTKNSVRGGDSDDADEQQLDSGHVTDNDTELPPYLNMNYLKHSLLSDLVLDDDDGDDGVNNTNDANVINQ